MTFKDCVEKGLIKKAEGAAGRVQQSLALGDRFLKSARRNLDIGEYEVCELVCYNALFHYARALLFANGYVERSHACLFVALRKFYPENTELFARADKLRVERHNVQYGGTATGKETAEFAAGFVQDFGETAKRILKKRRG